MSSKSSLESQRRPVTIFPVEFNPQQVKASKTARIGLVVLASSLKPIYCNSEALKILAYPNRPPRTRSTEFAKLVRSIVQMNGGADDFVKTFRFVSGRRSYLCRIFRTEIDSEDGFRPTVAITLERNCGVLTELLERFRLTDREGEAVLHLAEGLTSKEIAQRMNVSVNTVKVFLRLVMIKMGVTTRSGVVGKLVHRIGPDNGSQD